MQHDPTSIAQGFAQRDAEFSDFPVGDIKLTNADDSFSIKRPPAKWRWDVFGGKLLVCELLEEIPVPWWRRMITRIFLGSKWERIGD